MKRLRRPFKKRRSGRRVMVLLVGLAIGLGVVFLERRVMILVGQYARTRAEWYTTRLLNEAMETVLSDFAPQYEEVVNVTTDEAGNVMSVQANIETVNRLKSALSLEVAERLEETNSLTVSIPLFTLLGSRLWQGRGPRIEFPVPVGVSLLTDIDSTLSAAGINQTAHRIFLNVKANTFLAIPTAHTTVEVESSFAIAESVLLGGVPDAYTVVENVDEETIGEIFDYGAHMQN